MGEHFKENSEEESVRKAEGGDGSSLTSCRRKKEEGRPVFLFAVTFHPSVRVIGHILSHSEMSSRKCQSVKM